MKKFDIPSRYRDPIIYTIKELRKSDDPRKKDFSPTVLDFGPVQFLITRHFGFCYGVENAIEIAYKTIDENPGKRIFLLSEMIHNPQVNLDILSRGLQFIYDNYGNQLIDWKDITSNDIVIIPAFGTTIETETILKQKGIDIVKFNTTCPFVEKVWTRSEELGKQNYTIIIHGKAKHEETRATFSHSIQNAKALIVRNIEEAKFLSGIILKEKSDRNFYEFFHGKFSTGFDVNRDLKRISVVNQTTMLASETQEIANLLRETMIKRYSGENIKEHFADTHDTLCYATNDNQSATLGLLKEYADLAIVVGGYNSSNTSHIVELLEQKFDTYFISDDEKIISEKLISHFSLILRKEIMTENYLPTKEKVTIAITSGASCPDSIVGEVLNKLLAFFPNTKNIDSVMNSLSDC